MTTSSLVDSSSLVVTSSLVDSSSLVVIGSSPVVIGSSVVIDSSLVLMSSLLLTSLVTSVVPKSSLEGMILGLGFVQLAKTVSKSKGINFFFIFKPP